jgi:prepilin-type N-terminal cleavage/methylation domain-containing protein
MPARRKLFFRDHRSESGAGTHRTPKRFARKTGLRDAFTMVELLVVVAILGILSALVLPTVGKSIATAQMAKSMNNLRQLVIANQSYATDNGRYCPADNRNNTMRWCAKKVGGKWDRTQGYLSDYLGKSRAVGICPLFEATSKSGFEEGTGGYGYNSSYVGGLPSGSYTKDETKSRDSARLGSIHRATTVMFATCGYANGANIQEYPFCEPPFWDFGDGPTEWRPSPSVHFRFNNQALVGWSDGRVTAESCDPREVGFNPHGGDATAQKLGWFGPDAGNGFWNPHAEDTYANIASGR